MSSPDSPKSLSLHASADFLTMAVGQPGDGAPFAPKSETIEHVFNELESPLLGYARQLVGDFSLAEDLVQEAFMRLHSQFQQVQTPRPWLYRTVHNLAVDHQRRARRLVPLSTPDAEDDLSLEPAGDTPLPDEQIARSENVGLIRLVLETLDTRSREVVQLRFHEDLSYREISDRTGLGVGHVGYLLHHALKAMALELDRTGVTS